MTTRKTPRKTTRTTAPPKAAALAAALAYAADAACVVLFCTIGRRNHAEAVTLAGIAETAWPFLAGLTVAWLINRAWRRPRAVWPNGVILWFGTIVIGMGLRAGTGAGIAASFILVATAVTGALLLGWRAAANRAGYGAAGTSRD